MMARNLFSFTFIYIIFIINFGCQGKNVIHKELLDLSADINKKLELLDLCQEANLKIMPVIDYDGNTIKVVFKLSDAKFKDCFTHYVIILEQRRRTVDVAKIQYIYDKEKEASYTFQNVNCGLYEIVIQPCFNDWQCANLRIRYPTVQNMSSTDCAKSLPINNVSHTPVPSENVKAELILLVTIATAALMSASALVYYYYYLFIRREYDEVIEKDLEKGTEDSGKKKVIYNGIHILIVNHFDREGRVKQKAEIFRDFLEKSSLYKSVLLIEDELPTILLDPDEWINNVVNKVVERNADDGSILRLVIIDSQEENEDENYENENSICTNLIKVLANQKCLSLGGYDALFIVRFDGNQAHSRRITNFVPGSRYHIYNYNHLIGLCINLCSDSESNESEIKQTLQAKYANHPIKNLNAFESA